MSTASSADGVPAAAAAAAGRRVAGALAGAVAGAALAGAVALARALALALARAGVLALARAVALAAGLAEVRVVAALAAVLAAAFFGFTAAFGWALAADADLPDAFAVDLETAGRAGARPLPFGGPAGLLCMFFPAFSTGRGGGGPPAGWG